MKRNAPGSNGEDKQAINLDYRDYATVTEEEVVQEMRSLGNTKIIKHRQASAAKAKVDSIFPVKLHFLLSELERNGQDDIMAWQTHGRSFIVHDKQRFEAEILPRYAEVMTFARPTFHADPLLTVLPLI